jgi:hypothetical protein
MNGMWANASFTLPLAGRVGARKRAGVGVYAMFTAVTPLPSPPPQGGRERAGASG